MTRRPGLAASRASGSTGMSAKTSVARLTASFEYVGPARPEEAAGFGLPV